jgi:outer membrane protein OmpA-like peptidoglycan-associated protein
MKKQIVLRSISFDSGAAQLRPDAQPLLAELLRTLKDDPGFAISIEGHADSSEGSDDARAEAIALRRARVVREYLVANGIAASRIEVKAYGESRPIASNDTPDGRAQNRRVEFAYR